MAFDHVSDTERKLTDLERRLNDAERKIIVLEGAQKIMNERVLKQLKSEHSAPDVIRHW